MSSNTPSFSEPTDAEHTALPSGGMREALRLAVRLLDLAERRQRPAEMAQTLSQVARCYKALGAWGPAESYLAQALRWSRMLGGVDMAVELLCDLAEVQCSLAEVHDEDPVLHIEARESRARRKAGGVVWFDFQTLCGGPRSQNDYLEIATQFHTVLLSGVPYMPVNMASPARRFTWLVDVLYDRRVKLILSAAVAPEQLYTEGPLAHEFPRTVSRLNEMQSKEFLDLERRLVDTGLT